MKERPILFKGEMVRSILSGAKTQTRRVIKDQPSTTHEGEPYWNIGGYRAWEFRATRDALRRGGNELVCPYGKVGDRLWVRETFALEHQVDGDQKPPHSDGRPIKYEDDSWVQPHYRATDPVPDLSYEDIEQQNEPHCRWKRSMPRWASRITLEITGVRVERLKDISDGDAMAEGIYTELSKEDTAHGDMWMGTRLDGAECVLMPGVPAAHYSDIWESINGAGSWNANPWVWVVEFKRIEVTP